jgi:hypothetical protein
MSFKDHIEIKKAFLAKYNHLVEEKKRIPSRKSRSNEDFQYHSPLRLNLTNTLNLEILKYPFQSLQTNPESNLRKPFVLLRN